MPTYRDQGIVLRVRPSRDADRRYTLFTRDHGKITVLAKGLRRSRSKMSPHLAGFGVVDLMIARGRLMDRLAGASLARPFNAILEELPRISAAQGFLLTIDALTKRELPERRIFDLAWEFLEALAQTPVAADRLAGPVFAAASVRLLDILGFAPELAACVCCRQPLPAEGNALNAWRGGLECAACRRPGARPIAAPVIGALRQLRLGPLQAVNDGLTPDETVSRELAAAVDHLLASHLEDRLPVQDYSYAVV